MPEPVVSDSETIVGHVRGRYARIAKQGSSRCGTTCSAPAEVPVALEIGYRATLARGFPAGAY